jgi:hypothetical protein
MCVTVLSMEQSDTTASSGFMIAEAQRRSGAYSDRHPDLLDSRLDRIREWLGRELRRERLGAEKKAALEQSASDAARQLFHPRAWVWETHKPSPSR